MRSRLAFRLQATYLLVTLIFLLVAGLYLHQTLKKFYITKMAQHLLSQALLAGQVAGPLDEMRYHDEFALKFKTATGSRITIISADGTVFADSDRDPASMENHLYRPEIQQALNEPYGKSIRRSETVGTDFLYVAVPIRKGEKLEGFIRVALPLTELNYTVSAVRERFFYAFLTASLIAVLIGYLYSRTITRPIAAISDFTRRVAAGRFSERLRLTRRDEIGQLASQVNDMAAELERTIHLIQSEKTKVEAILRSLRDAVLVVDERGYILSVNPASATVLGVREESLVGRSLMAALRNSALGELFEEARKGHAGASRAISLKFPRELELEVNVSPVEENVETLPRFIVTARDISRLQKLEQIRVDFVANVSHELRSPLTAIRGFIETLQSGALADEEAAERFLQIMAAQADRLTRLLDDLLTLSNIELGKVVLRMQPLSLREVMEECFATLERKASEREVELIMVGLEETRYVVADRDRLVQILMNLIDNGVKFTPPGGTVTVSARPLPNGPRAAQPMLEVSVADTGVGIPEKDLPRISERFYRVDKTRSRELGGTGLGLAIVKHLVLAHGGSFRIESELEKGTTVRITLPGVE